MRIRSFRAMLVVACVALAIAVGAWQASASLSDLLFPFSLYGATGAPSGQPAGNGNFFSTMLGGLPTSDTATNAQMSGLLGIVNRYSVDTSPRASTVRGPGLSTPAGWTGQAVSPVQLGNNSNNVAMSSYDQLITQFPNQTNIFAPYSFAA